ncbi:MAG TPA: sulfite exporter TauE/SafE family protein [Urbifossiella sp.]|nr:sulfite exporter TauE/SafE family protein [Urbifossiella sp.]
MPADEIWTYLALAVCAFVAGAINSIAGGGTLLTFPALTMTMAANFANATSTVALLPGSFAGAIAYRKELAPSRRFVLRMIGPSIVGGFLGALFVGIYPKLFNGLVPWLVLTAALLFVAQAPVSRFMKAHRPNQEPGAAVQIGLVAFQFLIGIYGGYFGAGIGILMITTLTFMGVGDIHRVNAVKTFLAATINGASVIVFIDFDLVRWPFAAAMVPSAILGGYLGARVARRLPARYVRYAVIAIGFGLSIFYFVRQYG